MKQRLYEGIYVCPECDAKYELEDVPATQLFCEDCGAELGPADEEDGEYRRITIPSWENRR